MPRIEFKRALVTGGAGFIGSHIAERLLELGLEAVVIDDLSVGRLANIPSKVKFVHGSILDENVLREALEGVDAVFHNAARVSIRNSFDDAMKDAEVNILGTVNLLKECGRARIKKIIYASSMAVYGDNLSLPVAEKAALDPISPYGLSKLTGERYLKQISEAYGFEGVVLRYFNTYGPRQSFTPYVGVITIFATNLLSGKPPVIYGTGAQVRDYIYVKDVAEANVQALMKAPAGSVMNVGTGRGTSVNEIARFLIDKIRPGIQAEYAPLPKGEPKDSVADITEARRLIGFNPKTALKDKIDTVIEWNRTMATGHKEKISGVVC